MSVGHLEQRALDAKARRRAAVEEFNADDLAPIRIVETSRKRLYQMSKPDVDAAMKSRTVFFLRNRDRNVYAMVVPSSLILLLEIRDVLNDRRTFSVVPERAEVSA